MASITSHLSGIGIDVSDHHIRIAHISRFGGIKHLYEIKVPDGLVTDERVVDPKVLKELVLKEIKNSPYASGEFNVTVLIPESRVFSSSFILPKKLKGAVLQREAIKQGQKDIPLPIKQAHAAVSQGSKEGDGIRSTLYLVAKDVLNNLKMAFGVESFKIVAMDANTKALLRLFSKFADKKYKPEKAKDLVGVVDVGHTWSTVSFYTLAGSNVYSRTLQHNGRKETTPKGKELLSQISVDTIVSSLKESVLYFEQKGVKIKTIMLAGVEATSATLLKSTAEINKEIVVQPIGKLITVPSVAPQKLHIYGAAIGAALRSSHPRKYAYQHNFITE